MSEAQEAVKESAPKEEALAGVMIDFDDSDESPEPEQAAAEEADEPEVEAQSEEAEESQEAEDDESVAFDERQQKKLDQIIARNSYRYKTQIEAEQRRAQELEQRLQALEQGDSKPQAPTDPQTGAPVIPDPPDPFDS
jgi:ATPase subunit of ABC transporter with duplicated ATPase domains